jgi:uncharacterized protein (TIGR03083 family)
MATLSFSDMLKLIEDRSAVLRAAAVEAGLDALVPGCPDWSVRDLVAHLGEVHRVWAAVVAAGPAAQPPQDGQVSGLDPGDDLMAWSAASTDELIRVLGEAGPDRGCWTWWQESGAPRTSGAVARHQVQEAAVHAFDAQEAAGHAEPLPQDVAADGVGEFLTVGMASMGPWPHEPGRVALAASDGSTWVLDLSANGASATEAPPGTGATAAAAGAGSLLAGTASDLVLTLYDRNAQHDLDIDGDLDLATALLGWTDND